VQLGAGEAIACFSGENGPVGIETA